MERAAQLAAAARLDTLSVCVLAYGVARCHVALEGDLADAELGAALLDATVAWTFHPQRGEGFAERLVNAHEDAAAASGAPVVQVGADTPHLDAHTLIEVGARLTHGDDAVLGPAYGGGWWLLGVGGPHLQRHLPGVFVSTGETGSLTRETLVRAAAPVTDVEMLRDVDELADAESVATSAPGTRFARAFARTAP